LKKKVARAEDMKGNNNPLLMYDIEVIK